MSGILVRADPGLFLRDDLGVRVERIGAVPVLVARLAVVVDGARVPVRMNCVSF